MLYHLCLLYCVLFLNNEVTLYSWYIVFFINTNTMNSMCTHIYTKLVEPQNLLYSFHFICSVVPKPWLKYKQHCSQITFFFYYFLQEVKFSLLLVDISVWGGFGVSLYSVKLDIVQASTDKKKKEKKKKEGSENRGYIYATLARVFVVTNPQYFWGR